MGTPSDESCAEKSEDIKNLSKPATSNDAKLPIQRTITPNSDDSAASSSANSAESNKNKENQAPLALPLLADESIVFETRPRIARFDPEYALKVVNFIHFVRQESSKLSCLLF